MGVIDKKVIRITCQECATSEVAEMLQHGSSYGGSWQGAPTYTNFTVQWETPSSAIGPTAQSAVCNACGSTALIAGS